jgi:hypothetical protein
LASFLTVGLADFGVADFLDMVMLLSSVDGKAAIIRPAEPPADDARLGVSA